MHPVLVSQERVTSEVSVFPGARQFFHTVHRSVCLCLCLSVRPLVHNLLNLLLQDKFLKPSSEVSQFFLSGVLQAIPNDFTSLIFLISFSTLGYVPGSIPASSFQAILSVSPCNHLVHLSHTHPSHASSVAPKDQVFFSFHCFPHSPFSSHFIVFLTPSPFIH